MVGAVQKSLNLVDHIVVKSFHTSNYLVAKIGFDTAENETSKSSLSLHVLFPFFLPLQNFGEHFAAKMRVSLRKCILDLTADLANGPVPRGEAFDTF